MRRFWSEADLAVLKLYPSRPTAEVAAKLGRTISQVYAKANEIGLAKSPEGCGWLRKGQMAPGCNRAWFPKGSVPFNKGLKRPGWSPGRMKETQFRKGQRSGKAAKNWRPIGTILTDTEGYQRIKVREAVYGKEPCGFGNTKVWPLLNRYLWEQHKGPIPPKHMVSFKDGNRANCVIENLELISKADNARRNAMWNRYPPELIKAIAMNGAVKRQIRRLDGKEQNHRSAGPPV